MPGLYQLRVVLREVSPLIWRRLLVRSDTPVAELHAILQAVMSWRVVCYMSCSGQLEIILAEEVSAGAYMVGEIL
jgi:hypothetical protein